MPCSKELYPIGFRPMESGEGMRPKAVSHYLLEKMRMAGVRNAYFILREGKWDIPTYFGDGAMVDMNLGYLMMRLSFGTPYTLDQAYPFVRHSIVAFGFPDILFQGDDAFTKLLDRQAATEADVVLGLFPVERPWTMDMVEVNSKGEIGSLVIKPPDTHLEHGWIIAVWTPAFTEFLHEHLINLQKLSKTIRVLRANQKCRWAMCSRQHSVRGCDCSLFILRIRAMLTSGLLRVFNKQCMIPGSGPV